VRRGHVKLELVHQARESGRLALGKIQQQGGKGRGVHDWMCQRAFEASADEPGVECVVAVLDEDRALGEAKEGATRIAELGRPDQH
jgi:hypothetical protein